MSGLEGKVCLTTGTAGGQGATPAPGYGVRANIVNDGGQSVIL